MVVSYNECGHDLRVKTNLRSLDKAMKSHVKAKDSEARLYSTRHLQPRDTIYFPITVFGPI